MTKTKIVGTLLELDNKKKIHIRTMGTGKDAIVILPGFNVHLPTVEFAPLMRELATRYTVCTIDLLGYGYSDPADTPRTNENYVEEIRMALKKAGLKPPYALLPYSCSGLYAEYYAVTYPAEIKALLLLDTTPSIESWIEKLAMKEEHAEELRTDMQTAYSEAKANPAAQWTAEESQEYFDMYTPFGYTQEDLISYEGVYNDIETLVSQALSLSECVKEVTALTIPTEIPILLIRSRTGELELMITDEKERKKALDDYHRDNAEYMKKLGKSATMTTIGHSSHGNIYYFHKIIGEEIDKILLQD